VEDIISLEEICYSYYDKIPAVCDISLSIKEGERFAIIGANGSGKSTLASLLVRFRDFPKGSYTLGGADVRNLDDDDVRKRVGLLEQNPHIFATTLRENIRLAKPGQLPGAYNKGTTMPRLVALPLVHVCHLYPPIAAVPLSSAKGAMGPANATKDSKRPSKSDFSVPGWKPHSISTSMRFHAPRFGPVTRMLGTADSALSGVFPLS
jgi:ABC-type oligopeptide transport system ATPase subunit